KKVIEDDKIVKGAATIYQPIDSIPGEGDIFQSEFEDEIKDSTVEGRVMDINDQPVDETVLSQAKLYDYRLKFATEYSVSGFNNSVLMTRWQPYGGGGGPI